jgi:hypothetical protein
VIPCESCITFAICRQSVNNTNGVIGLGYAKKCINILTYVGEKGFKLRQQLQNRRIDKTRKLFNLPKIKRHRYENTM